MKNSSYILSRDNVDIDVGIDNCPSMNNSLNKGGPEYPNDTENVQKKCYLLGKLLAHQIKPDFIRLANTKNTPQVKPFKVFGSISDKSSVFPDLSPAFSDDFTASNLSTETSSCKGNKFHLLGPFTNVDQDVFDQGPPFTRRRNDPINLFGAMAVSFKADFLQSCAAALLRRRVSYLLT